MARRVFTWFPEVGNRKKVQPAVTPMRFGDGYELRQPNGINTKKQVWSVMFTGPERMIDDIDTFLDDHGAHLAFDWTTPKGYRSTFVCRAWDYQRNKGTHSVTADFEEVFEA